MCVCASIFAILKRAHALCVSYTCTTWINSSSQLKKKLLMQYKKTKHKKNTAKDIHYSTKIRRRRNIKKLKIRSPILLCKMRKSKKLIETNANDGNDYETRIYRNEHSNHHIVTCNDEHWKSKLKSTKHIYSVRTHAHHQVCERKENHVCAIGANETNTRSMTRNTEPRNEIWI